MGMRRSVLVFVGLMAMLHASSSFAAGNPEPVQQVFITSDILTETHLFDGADSVWVDGEWHEKNGLFGTRYLSTFVLRQSSYPAIQVLNLGVPNTSLQPLFILKCPRKIGHIGIVGVGSHHDSPWYLVNFTSTSGTSGSVNLLTHRWNFNQSKAHARWNSIDPFKRLSFGAWFQAMKPSRETSLWIDGDWHTSNGFGQRYVASMVTAGGEPGCIQVQDENRGTLNHNYRTRAPLLFNYPVPSNISYFTITNITDHGNLIHIRGKSGDILSFNLTSRHWLVQKNRLN